MTSARAVLPLCFNHLELGDVVNLASTSKLMLLECLVYPPNSVLHRWVTRAITKAQKAYYQAPSAQQAQAHSLQAQANLLHTKEGKDLAWMLRQCSGLSGIVTLSSRLGLQGALVSACGDPGLCRLLISQGARFSYELFSSTACQQLGPVTWVEVYQAMGVSSPLPASVAAFCSGHQLLTEELQQLSALDLLIITSISCSLPYNSTFFQWLLKDAQQTQLWTTAQLQQLLHWSIVCSPQSSAGSELSNLTQHALSLAALPTVQQLPWEDKVQALRACNTHKKNGCGKYLHALLPHALTIEETSSLVRAAIHSPHPSNIISALFKPVSPFWNPQQQSRAPPGSTLLPVYTIKELIEETMKSDPPEDAATLLDRLLSLPAAAQLSAKDVMELLLTAAALNTTNLQPYVWSLLEHLCSKFLLSSGVDAVAHGVSLEQLGPLLLMLLKADELPLHNWLLQLVVAQQLSRETVAELLAVAVNRRLAAAVPLLLELPGAQQLTSSTLSVMLVCAVEGMYAAVGLLTQTTAAQRLGGDELVKPLQLSLESLAAGITTTCLLELPGLQLLPVA